MCSSDLLIRAEQAKAEKIRQINDQQFGHQTSLMTKLQKHWVGVSVAIYASMRAIRAGWQLMEDAATFEQQKKAFDSLTASYGVNGSRIISELKKISSNTISTMVLVEKAGTAMMMGIAPDKVIHLMEIAKATARMTGQSVSQAFSDILLAVGRQSKMILDNLGIIVSVEKANEAYAISLGKTRTELTDTDKKMAFMNATLLAGEELMRRLGEQSETTRDKMDRLTTVFANLKIQIGAATLALVGFIEKMTDKSLDIIFGPTTGDPKELAKQALQKQLELAMRSYKLMAQQGNIDQETLHLAEARMFTLRQRIAILEESIRIAGIKDSWMGRPGSTPPPGSTAPPPAEDTAMLRLEEQAALMMAKSKETLTQKTDMEKFMESGLTDALYDMRQKRLENETGFAQKSLELNQWEHDAVLQIMQIEQEEKLALQSQFNEQYNALGKSQYDLERENIHAMAEAYRQAGADKVEVAKLTAAKIKSIAMAETDAKLAMFQNNASNISATFLQIAQAGGKQSRKAFEVYKRFAQIEAGISAARAILMALGSPPGPPWSFITAGITAGMAGVQVAMIEKSQPPSYDQGGISRAQGVYQTGNISEAHIPLKSGKVPVNVTGGGSAGTTFVIKMENPVFQDVDTQRQVFAQIAEVIARRVAPDAVIQNYNDDLGIRRMVRGRA